MPNGKTHQVVGAASGAAYAAYLAQNETDANWVFEALGGAIGGTYAARLPDIIDPATSPNHRSIAHGMIPVSYGVHWSNNQAKDLQVTLREFAKSQAEKSESSDRPLECLAHGLLAIFSTIVCGAVVGAVAGYTSHVVLDAMTPAGLPVVGKGF